MFNTEEKERKRRNKIRKEIEKREVVERGNKICPYCKKEIRIDIFLCPHCK